MRKLVVLIVMILGAAARAQDAARLVTLPEQRLATGQPATIVVTFLNRSAATTQVRTPSELRATLTTRDATLDATLTRDGGADVQTIAAGAFFEQRYTFVPTRDDAGPIVAAINDAAPSVASASQPMTTDNEPTTNRTDVLTSHTGFVEYFSEHFSGHEPVYFLVGPDQPNAKFQVSFKYRVFNEDGGLARAFPPITGFHLAYSQTSFWDLEGDSKPFFDNSYRPEALVSYDSILPSDVHIPAVSRLGLQAGVQHESNGRGGADSRSLNIAYVRPVFVFGDEQDFFLTLAPRVFAYIGDLSDNPDIDEFRGHADLRAVVGWGGGLQLAAIGRLGDDLDRGSLQLDLTYPLRAQLDGNVDVYFHVQYFTGYGESLLRYNDADNVWRIGISLVR